MYEELYIIDGSKRLKVDLSTPSGITLNFKSNIFGDLSKITCSYSYTFKLPLTANNRRVFDNADDIRCFSNKIRKRLRAEYIQNGIPLFSNANLYIDSTESCFNAVMTWGVIDGLQKLKDEDCSLRELPNDETETTFGPFELNDNETTPPSRGDGGISDTGETTHNFDNLALVLGPDYNCGIPHRLWKRYVYSGHRPATWSTYNGTYPMPVVPVYKILSLIKEKFDIDVHLGKHLTTATISSLEQRQEIIEVGVIPLVGVDLTLNQLSKRMGTYKDISFVNINATLTEQAGETSTSAVFKDAIFFGSYYPGEQDYFKSGSFGFSNSGSAGTNRANVGPMPLVPGMSLEIDGHIRAVFTDYYATQSHPLPSDVPELKVYQRVHSSYRPNVPGYRTTNRAYYEWKEICSLTGVADGRNGNYTIYDFNFSSKEMFERLKCENLSASNCSPLLFSFSAKLKDITSRPIEIHLINNNQGTYKFDVISNLPDISVLTFLKSLFYMIGAFPSIDSKSQIVPMFYSDIRQNLLSGRVVDWSKKVNTDASKLPIKTAYSNSEYAQNNYFLMKSEKEDDSNDKEDDLVYELGRGCIQVDNGVIERNKNIIQLPFYAPLLYDKLNRNYDMGQTFKCWDFEGENRDKKKKWISPKPCLGLIRDREYYTSVDDGPYEVSGTVMSMIVWNGFKDMEQNESYNYLQKVIRHPIVITDNLNLTEIDLANLDYSVPVYLDKYSAYFAIVSIVRDSKGVCKCELIKLPEEESNG